MPTSTKAQFPNRQLPKLVTLVWATDFILRKTGGQCRERYIQTIKLEPNSFFVLFFETGSLYIALVVLELATYIDQAGLELT